MLTTRNLAGDIAIWIAALPLVLAPIAYHFLSTFHNNAKARWWRTSMGWHLMSYMSALAIAGSIAIANMLWGPLPEWFRPAAWGLIAVIAWWRLIIVITTDYNVARIIKDDDESVTEGK